MLWFYFYLGQKNFLKGYPTCVPLGHIWGRLPYLRTARALPGHVQNAKSINQSIKEKGLGSPSGRGWDFVLFTLGSKCQGVWAESLVLVPPLGVMIGPFRKWVGPPHTSSCEITELLISARLVRWENSSTGGILWDFSIAVFLETRKFGLFLLCWLAKKMRQKRHRFPLCGVGGAC